MTKLGNITIDGYVYATPPPPPSAPYVNLRSGVFALSTHCFGIESRIRRSTCGMLGFLRCRGELMLLWYFVNQQFSEVSSPLTPHFEIQQFSECSRRSLLPNLPCEYRLELFKLPWQRTRLLSPVPNSLNRPNLSPLFYALFSLFHFHGGYQECLSALHSLLRLDPSVRTTAEARQAFALTMCHRHPKESGRVLPLLGPCTLLATTFE